MQIKNKRQNINDYVLDDFIIENYQFHETIKMNIKTTFFLFKE